MLSIDTKSNRLGTGCLMLFALPFAAVGVGALVWSVWTLLDWRAAAGWVPVPAEIVAVALEEHTTTKATRRTRRRPRIATTTAARRTPALALPSTRVPTTSAVFSAASTTTSKPRTKGARRSPPTSIPTIRIAPC